MGKCTAIEENVYRAAKWNTDIFYGKKTPEVVDLCLAITAVQQYVCPSKFIQGSKITNGRSSRCCSIFFIFAGLSSLHKMITYI